MANFLMVVTNEDSIARSQMNYLASYENIGTVDPYEFDITDENSINSAISAWKSIKTDEVMNKFINIGNCINTYNIIYVPFAGFCYTVMKDRFEHNTDNKYALVSIKERFQSLIVTNGLYNIYLDSRKQIPASIITEMIDNMNGNQFLTSEFDIVETYTKDLYTYNNNGLLCDLITKYADVDK